MENTHVRHQLHHWLNENIASALQPECGRAPSMVCEMVPSRHCSVDIC
jgi:hypothetical protein